MTRKQEVLTALCDAVSQGRHANPNDPFKYATDCFCTERPDWNFQWDAVMVNIATEALRLAFATAPAEVVDWKVES